MKDPLPPQRLSDRDPEATRINVLGSGLGASLKARLLKGLARSPLSWRMNFSVDARVGDHSLKIPIMLGRGYQNLQIGEAWLFRAFAKVLDRREGAFVDVGVNLGQTLIKVKLIDPQREYYGFEPNPQCSQYVSELINCNGFTDCTLVPVGLSTAPSVATLWAKADAVDPSASMVPGFRSAERYARKQHVPVFPGDALLSQVDRMAMLKIDVEGGELEVVSGLLETLARCTPIVFCEILPVFDETTDNGQFRKRRQDELLGKLRALGYSAFRMMQDETVVELAAIETHASLALTNYAFVPPAEVDAFRRLFRVTQQSAAA
jgi:FkbM family methyltransferase